jgi:hypothetical protein
MERKTLGDQALGEYLLAFEHHLGPIAQEQLEDRPRHGQQAGAAQGLAQG